MDKRWITFDLDGTLMQNPFVSWVFPEIEQLVREAIKKKDHVVIPSLVEEHERRMNREEYVAAYDWDEIVQVHLDTYALDLTIDVEGLVKKHCISPKVYLLEDGIVETLKQLMEKGYALAAVTNGFYKYQVPVMDALGLTPLFEAIVTPEMVGCGKPHMGILSPLFLKGRVVAHVGDRLDHDVQLANRTGVHAVWVYRKLPEHLRLHKPWERIKDGGIQALYQEKWLKETKSKDYPNDVQPDSIIYSIKELLEYKWE